MPNLFVKIIRDTNVLSCIILIFLILRFFYGFSYVVPVILVSVFTSCLSDYIRRKEINRRFSFKRGNRFGERWLYVWVAVAAIMFILAKANLKFTFPAEEFCIILPFVFFQRWSSWKDKKEYEEEYVNYRNG